MLPLRDLLLPRKVARVLLDVDCVASLVADLGQRGLLPLGGTPRDGLARPRLVEGLVGGVGGQVGQLACRDDRMVLAGGLVLLHNLVDEAAVLLQTELSIVTNLRPYLGRALRKLLPAVELPQVGMLGDLEHRRSFLRVEAERPAQQVVGLRGAVAHPLLATDWLYLREDVEHLSAEVSLERAQVLDGGRASPSEHSLDLVEGGVSGEHGLAREQFAQQAPETPNVRCLRVLLGPQEDLGSPVPARGNVVG